MLKLLMSMASAGQFLSHFRHAMHFPLSILGFFLKMLKRLLIKLRPEKTKLVFGKLMLPDHFPIVSYSGMSFFLEASIKIGYFFEGILSVVAIKSSSAKGFSEIKITPVFLGSPFEGPFPSWAMSPSTIFKVGLTTE